MSEHAAQSEPAHALIYPDGYVGLFFELPDDPEDQRWRWELWKGGALLDWEYAPSVAVCQRECSTYARMHRYVASKDHQVA